MLSQLAPLSYLLAGCKSVLLLTGVLSTPAGLALSPVERYTVLALTLGLACVLPVLCSEQVVRKLQLRDRNSAAAAPEAPLVHKRPSALSELLISQSQMPPTTPSGHQPTPLLTPPHSAPPIYRSKVAPRAAAFACKLHGLHTADLSPQMINRWRHMIASQVREQGHDSVIVDVQVGGGRGTLGWAGSE